MVPPTRRSLLHISGSLLAGGALAGCTSTESSGGETSPTATTTKEPPQTTVETDTETKTTANRTVSTTNASTENSNTTLRDPTTEQPTSETASRQETKAMCNGVRSLTFYSIGSDLWDSNTVRVAFTIESGAQIRLVVFENSTILGMTQIKGPSEGEVTYDGQPIPLTVKLSGEHTIRAVAYPNTTEDG